MSGTHQFPSTPLEHPPLTVPLEIAGAEVVAVRAVTVGVVIMAALAVVTVVAAVTVVVGKACILWVSYSILISEIYSQT